MHSYHRLEAGRLSLCAPIPACARGRAASSARARSERGDVRGAPEVAAPARLDGDRRLVAGATMPLRMGSGDRSAGGEATDGAKSGWLSMLTPGAAGSFDTVTREGE